MACDAQVLKNVPLFALLDDEEAAVLAGQVELRNFAARERIYKIGDASGPAYVMVSGKVRVSTVDEDQQDVLVDQPSKGEFFGFASMLEQTPHQTNAVAAEDTACLEITRDNIAVLLQRQPLAGMDLLTALGRQFHASQELCASAPAAIQMKLSKPNRPWGSVSPTRWRPLADPGLLSCCVAWF